MKGVILAGGFAKRLMPLTIYKAKPMLPVANKPVLMYNIQGLKKAGVTDIIISTNERFYEDIKNLLGDGSKYGLKFDYVIEKTKDESEKLGAVKAMNYVFENREINEECIIIAGDNIHGLDLKKMIEFHKSKGSPATIALFDLEDLRLAKLYGVATLNNDKKVKKYVEKPAEPSSTLIGTACYIFSPEICKKILPEFLNKSKNADNLGEFIGYLAENHNIYGYKFSGVWHDVGSSLTYLEANISMLNKLKEKEVVEIAKTAKVLGNLVGSGIIIEDDVIVEPGAKILGPVVLKRGVKVEKESIVGPYSQILDNVIIKEKSMVDGATIFENSVIGSKSRISACIICNNCNIGEEVSIEKGAIIGSETKINEHTRVLAFSKIGPKKEIGADSLIGGTIL